MQVLIMSDNIGGIIFILWRNSDKIIVGRYFNSCECAIRCCRLTIPPFLKSYDRFSWIKNGHKLIKVEK